jgi:hypothetical protein
MYGMSDYLTPDAVHLAAAVESQHSMGDRQGRVP